MLKPVGAAMKDSVRGLLLLVRRMASRCVTPAVGSHVQTYTYVAPQDSIIYKTATFAAVNKVQGDYLEFGVFQGSSFLSAYYTICHCFQEVINCFGFTMSERDRALTISLCEKMRFFAFDSFEGLPEAKDSDSRGFFAKGQFRATLDDFKNNLVAANFPLSRSVIVNGWYEHTLKTPVYDQHQLTRAAIVHIDCDLYESTQQVLEFITPLLVDGTILIFDDWFHFNGHPLRGEQRAFNEWAAKLSNWSFSPYQQEGAWRKCFIANEL